MTSSTTAGEKPASATDNDAPERTPKHLAARELALKGIPIFPCIAGDKRPATEHGFQNASTDVEQIDLWWAEADYNVAFSPEAAGLCVIDIDNEDTWTGLELEHGDVPTYAVRTPSGGLHLYYRGSLPSSASKLGAGVDTRGRGGYVLVPPSSVSGAPYTVKSDLPCADLPGWVTSHFKLREHRSAIPGTALDHPVSLARARSRVAHYIKTGDVAIEGQGGNDRTYRLLAEMFDFGLSGAAAREVIAPWNAACVPPWPDDEMETILWSAQRNRQNDIGCAVDTETLQEKFGDAAPALGAPNVRSMLAPEGAPPFAANDEWQARVASFKGRTPAEGAKLPPLEYWDDRGIIPKLLGGSVGIVYGPSGAFKSAIVMAEAMHAVLDRGARVLFCTGEGSHGVEKARVPALCDAHGIALEVLTGKWITVDRTINLSEPADVDALIEAHKDFRPNIILTDTLATAIPGLNENDASTASRLTGNTPVGSLRRRFDAALIFCHHTGKDETHGPRGSSGFTANADFALEVKLGRGVDTVELIVKKMKDGRALFTVHYTIEWWLNGAQVGRAKGVPVPRRITPEEYRSIRTVVLPAETSGVSMEECKQALRRLGAVAGGEIVATPVLAAEIALMREAAGRPDCYADNIKRNLTDKAKGSLGTFVMHPAEHRGDTVTWQDRCADAA